MQKLVLCKGIALMLILLTIVMCCCAFAVCEDDDSFESSEPYEQAYADDDMEPALYALVYLGHDGEPLAKELLTEGERIMRPFFMPTVSGYNFLFWFDANECEQTKRIVEFEFGRGIYKDTVLTPYYAEVRVPEPAPVDGDATALRNAAPIGMPDADTKGIPTENPDFNDGLYVYIIEDSEYGSLYNDGLYFDVIDVTNVEDEPPYGDGLNSDGDVDGGTEDQTESEEDESDDPCEADDNDDEVLETALAEEALEAKNTAAGDAGYAIQVFTTHSENMEEGTPIRVWAELSGFTAEDATLQWQYSVSGSHWVDVPGATGIEHIFEATSKSVNYSWRLLARVESGEPI